MQEMESPLQQPTTESDAIPLESTRARRQALIAILGFCVGLPVLSAIVTGSIAIPHNDDWAFFRILFHLAETGDLQLVGWNEMMLMGQLLWALPIASLLGDNLGAVTVVNALISGLGLILTYLFATRFVAARWALLITLTVGIFPGFSALVTTFMTEPTAYAAQLGCLLLGLAAFRSDGRTRLAYLSASMLVGLYGFSVREFAVAAPLAVLVGMCVAEIREKRVPLFSIIGGSMSGIAVVSLYLWRQSLAGGNSHFFGVRLGQWLVVEMSQNFFTASLGLVPVLVFLIARKRPELTLATAAAGIAVISLAVLALNSSVGEPTCCLGGTGSVFRGNLLTERGPLGNQVLPGQRPEMPVMLWVTISATGIAAGALIAMRSLSVLAAPIRYARDLSPDLVALWSFGIITAGSIVFRSALGGPSFDRYLTPVVLVGAILVARDLGGPPEPRVPRGPAVAVAALAVLSLAFVTGGHSFDAARWKAAEQATDSGIAAQNIDGGFEWVGYHHGGITNEPTPARGIPYGPGYLYMFPRAGNCIVVSSSPSQDGRLEAIGSRDYRTYLGLGTETLWIYRFAEACQVAGVP